jgi:hypothetical protein
MLTSDRVRGSRVPRPWHDGRATPPAPSAGVRRRGVLVRLAVGVAVATLTGTGLVLSMTHPRPLDDSDLARQRAGMLDVVGPRSIAAAVTAQLPAFGARTVVFFVRPAQLAPLEQALGSRAGSQLRAAAAVVIVVSPDPGASSGPATIGAVPVQLDPAGRLAVAYRMRRPRDGGAPVGYSVVGRDRTVRYRTEDPDVAAGLVEVRTIVDAVP